MVDILMARAEAAAAGDRLAARPSGASCGVSIVLSRYPSRATLSPS
jgi:hypothetical protein